VVGANSGKNPHYTAIHDSPCAVATTSRLAKCQGALGLCKKRECVCVNLCAPMCAPAFVCLYVCVCACACVCVCLYMCVRNDSTDTKHAGASRRSNGYQTLL